MRELGDRDVEAVVDVAMLVDQVSACLADLGRGQAHQAPAQVLPIGPGAFFLSLAAVVPRLGLGVAKWASYVPATAAVPGRSTSTVIASDATTGVPVVVVTGMRATHLRTAATVIAAVRAARPGACPRRVGLVGFGPTNQAVLDAVRATTEGIEEIRVIVRSESEVATVRDLAARRGLDMLRAGTNPAALTGADLAVSATGAAGAVATVADLAPDGVAVSLDGRRTWRHDASTPVLSDHGEPGLLPQVPRMVAGTVVAPPGRVLLDLTGSAVADVALVSVLLGATEGAR